MAISTLTSAKTFNLFILPLWQYYFLNRLPENLQGQWCQFTKVWGMGAKYNFQNLWGPICRFFNFLAKIPTKVFVSENTL